MRHTKGLESIRNCSITTHQPRPSCGVVVFVVVAAVVVEATVTVVVVAAAVAALLLLVVVTIRFPENDVHLAGTPRHCLRMACP